MGKTSQEAGATTDAGQSVTGDIGVVPLQHGSRPQVTGSRSGGQALVSLLNTLARLGLIIDKTTS